MDDLQEMAGKYADTVEENRRLYNEVQDLKGNIRVFCRIRPPGTTGDQNPSCLDTGVDGEVPASCTLCSFNALMCHELGSFALQTAFCLLKVWAAS